MIAVRVVLLILAAVCFLLAALGVATPRGNLMAAGLLCWILTELIR
jgi:hypothetical protein